jgi:hypothetical protein
VRGTEAHPSVILGKSSYERLLPGIERRSMIRPGTSLTACAPAAVLPLVRRAEGAESRRSSGFGVSGMTRMMLSRPTIPNLAKRVAALSLTKVRRRRRRNKLDHGFRDDADSRLRLIDHFDNIGK